MNMQKGGKDRMRESQQKKYEKAQDLPGIEAAVCSGTRAQAFYIFHRFKIPSLPIAELHNLH